jgi:hypothetical protein
MPLKSIVAELNRTNARQLAIANPAVENLRLSGAVCPDRLDTVIRALRGLGVDVVEIGAPTGIGVDGAGDFAPQSCWSQCEPSRTVRAPAQTIARVSRGVAAKYFK